MYYLVYGFLKVLSFLPLRVLYLLSDFAYVIIYHLMGYRKEVVMKNLSIAFPKKTEEEKVRIAKQFYRNFTDTFIETIKLFSAGPDFLNRHVEADYTLIHRIENDRRKCQVHAGHNFNWELVNLACALHVRQKFLGVYMPLGNKVFDRIFIKLRSKFGTILLPATSMREAMMPHRNDPYFLGLVADQSTAIPEAGYWITFFGKPAPFVKGPERGARTHNLTVVFAHFTKRKRGYYQLHLRLAEENPASLPEGELTRRYVRYLEEVISAHPEMWLWSHRRWKFEWKPEYGDIIG
jgi:Kdo2-lipid IVA lauroyltransferase/acyltransferase